MNRELKFRVWEYHNNRFMNIPYGVGLDKNFNLNAVNDSFDGITQKFAIQQYTGIKDKNGVEIYEGDKMKIPTEFTNLVGDPIFDYGIVEFCEYEDSEGYGVFDHLGWVVKGKTSFIDRYAEAGLYDFKKTLPDCRHCEVVGNIFDK